MKTDKELLIILLNKYTNMLETGQIIKTTDKVILGICDAIVQLEITDCEDSKLRRILDKELPKEMYGKTKSYCFPLTYEGCYQRIGFLQTLIEKY
jgi:hypothetical protein